VTTVHVRWKAWHGDEICTLQFPPAWDVEVFGMPALPAVGPTHIKNAILNPIGEKPLQRLVNGRKTAAIAVDDLSRPTPLRHGLSVVLEELRHAGIKAYDISILVALGTHSILGKTIPY